MPPTPSHKLRPFSSLGFQMGEIAKYGSFMKEVARGQLVSYIS
jgi:hypothetical protein